MERTGLQEEHSGGKPDTTKKVHSVQSSRYILSQVDEELTMQSALMKEASDRDSGLEERGLD